MGEAFAIYRKHNRRFVIAVDEARCDDADHPDMPVYARQNQRVRLVVVEAFFFDALDRFVGNDSFDALAFGVSRGELAGDVRRPGGVGRCEKFDRLRGVSHAAGGVETRGQDKSYMKRLERFLGQLNRVEQCPDAHHVRAGQASKPEGRQHAVFTHKRHDVGDGSHGSQGGRIQEERFHSLGDARPVVILSRDFPRELQRNTRAAQIGVRVACADSRVHDRDDIGESFGGRVVVGDDHVDGSRDLGERRSGAYAAVDGDDQFGALIDEPFQGVGIEAIPFGQAVGHVGFDRRAELGQARVQDRGGGHAIDVVVAVDNDFFVVADRLQGPPGSGLAPWQGSGIVQGGQFRMEKRTGGVDIDQPTITENLRGERVNVQLPRQRLRLVSGWRGSPRKRIFFPSP